MFGKRSETPLGAAGFTGAAPTPAAARTIAIRESVVAPRGAPIPAVAAGAPGRGSNGTREAAKPQAPINSPRSDNYYDIKSTIFNALIDAIDLTQLGQLDRESARDEIRDIVNEIIALKDVVMSIAEQEELLEDICNDVLGYGPLEPLLARDDIADIMINGAD